MNEDDQKTEKGLTGWGGVRKTTNELSKSVLYFCSESYDKVSLYQPYAELARLDRPIGWWLLLLPGWWALAMASGGLGGMGVWEWYLAFLFFIGSVVMRGAGCVINDLWDRDFDRQVTRTKTRPLANGTLSPAKDVRQNSHIRQSYLFSGQD